MSALRELDNAFGSNNTEYVKPSVNYNELVKRDLLSLSDYEFKHYMLLLADLATSDFPIKLIEYINYETFKKVPFHTKALFWQCLMRISSSSNNSNNEFNFVEGLLELSTVDFDDKSSIFDSINSRIQLFLDEINVICDNRWIYNSVDEKSRFTDSQYILGSLFVKNRDVIDDIKVRECVEFYEFMMTYYYTEVLQNVNEVLTENELLTDFKQQVDILNSSSTKNGVSISLDIKRVSEDFMLLYGGNERICPVKQWYQYILTELLKIVYSKCYVYFGFVDTDILDYF